MKQKELGESTLTNQEEKKKGNLGPIFQGKSSNWADGLVI